MYESKISTKENHLLKNYAEINWNGQLFPTMKNSMYSKFNS